MRPVLKTLALLGLLALTAGGVGAQAWRLDSPPSCQEQAPKVLALGGGAFAAVWQGGADPGVVGKPRVFARVFDPHGVPRGPEFLVNGDYDAVLLDAAVNAEGHFLVVWHDLLRRQVRSRAFGATRPLGSEKVVFSDFVPAGLALTATHDGGFAMVTAAALSIDLYRFDSLGQLHAGAPREVESWASVQLDPPTFRDPAVAAYGPDRVVVAWAVEDEGERSILARSVAYPGIPIQVLPVSARGLTFEPGETHRPRPAVAVNAAGRALVAWNEHTPRGDAVRAQVFTADRRPLNVLPLDLEAPAGGMVSAPAAAAGVGGDFLVAWHSLAAPPAAGVAGRVARVGDDGALTGPPLHAWDASNLERPSLDLDAQGFATAAFALGGVTDGAPVESCSSQGVYARRLDASSTVLPLYGGRFEMRIEWTDHAGNRGEGRAIPLSGDSSGYFWFFSPENVEVMVKVLDGRYVNEHIWVFYASLTDVAFTLTVTDTRSGETRTYDNPAGRLASRADTTAFPEEPPFFPGADAPASAAARSHLPGAGGPAAGPCTDPSLPTERRPGLCLGGRFEVEAAWHANGATGDAGGSELTADSGTLWFFGRNNVELVVKVLDGRAVNGRFWVFSGALTDVEHTLLVRDTVTGQVRTYHNPAGRLRSLADTAAF